MLVLLACADERPVEPGEGLFELLSFDADDDVRVLDGPGGLARAHYSLEGPNAIHPADWNADGVPDRAYDAVVATEQNLRRFEFEGYAPPAPEDEFDLDAPGGSDAFDVYLLDLSGWPFAGLAGRDACTGGRCSTYVVLKSVGGSFDGIVAHEVFHAVQAAYDRYEPAWLHESTAEHAANVVFGDRYLSRTTCGLDSMREPSDCYDAAYGLGLLWEMLEVEVSEDIVRETIEATVEHEGLDALEVALDAHGTSIADVWPTFAIWNLKTGIRHDGTGYGIAASFEGLLATAEGETLRADTRLEPLAQRFYRLDHPGGDLWIGVAGDPTPLTVSVHPVAGGLPDGPLAAAFGPVGLPPEGLHVGDVDAGGVWVVVTHTDAYGEEIPIGLCMGDEAVAASCAVSCAGCASAHAGLPALALLVSLLGLRGRAPPGRATPRR
ncbi:MAG: hypothetical protein ACOZNI_14005 [Myxococcota bacterium]